MFELVYGWRLIATSVASNTSLHNLSDDASVPVVNPAEVVRRDAEGHYTTYVTRAGRRAQLIVEWSHRCHIPMCMNPAHALIEIKIVNDGRKDCSGPDGQGQCQCMRDFVQRNRLQPQSIDRLHSCLRRASDVRNVRIMERAGVISTDYQRQQHCLPGPFPREELSVADTQRRVADAARLLVESGLTFERLPHLFLNFTILDEWVRAQLEERKEAGAAGASFHVRTKAYKADYYSRCRERVTAIKRRVEEVRNAGERANSAPDDIEGNVNTEATSQLSQQFEEEEPAAQPPAAATMVTPPSAATLAPKKRGPKRG